MEIRSAGLAATPGRPIEPRSARALRGLGGDPEAFTSLRVATDLAEGADLILTMTREQRRAVLGMRPRGLRHTFTLTEAAALLERADLDGLGELPLDHRAREFGRRLDTVRAYRTGGPADDVTDPVGRRFTVHDEVAHTIATALRPLAEVLFTPTRPRWAASA